jgi:2-polyprenyl-6-methoxyphenol hydroxylase-like FAD-dependent oxidoreductase
MDVEVLIAGGGPVGFFLACELRRAGIAVAVAEAEAGLSAFSATTIRGLTTRTIRLLRLRGLADTMIEAAWVAERERLAAEDRTREAAIATSEFIAGMWPNGLLKGHWSFIPMIDRLGEYPDIQVVPIPYAEAQRVLAEKAVELGAEVWWGSSVTGFDADEEGVTVRLGDGRAVRTAYLVGVDGGRSTVRKRAGFAFHGTDPTLLCHGGETVVLDDDATLPPGFTHLPDGVVMNAAFPGQVLVTEFAVPQDERRADFNTRDYVTAPELQASLRRVTGTDVSVFDVRNPIRYTDHARQATDYRIGRVLLAGDAAHVHPPYGAQGLNMGLQDAANLGWKLALVVRGRMSETLLDTYTAERHPVAARTLRNTRAQVAMLRTSAQVDALREVFAELIELPEVKRYLIEWTHGLDIRLDVGHDHPLSGLFAPDLPLDGFGPLDDGRAVLLDLRGSSELSRELHGWSDRVRLVAASAPELPELAALLIRPDGYVAWAADDGDTRSARPALRRWFGQTSAEQSVTPA